MGFRKQASISDEAKGTPIMVVEGTSKLTSGQLVYREAGVGGLWASGRLPLRTVYHERD